MYRNPHFYLRSICYRSYLVRHSLARNVPVQQLLWQVLYASSHSVWQLGWTRQYNQTNHADLWTLLESPLHILELEDVISIVESSCTILKRPIMFFVQAGNPEIGGSGSAESTESTIQEIIELGLGRCYQGYFPYIQTQMLCDSGIIPWFVSLYCTLQSIPRRSTDVGQWNGWR